MEKRAWVEIDLDALASNMRAIRRITDPNAMVMAVVKADAYGHGAKECAKILLRNGADRLAVATLGEAMELRREFKDVPIMILGSFMDDEAEDIINNDIIPSVYTFDSAKFLSDTAVRLNKPVKVHIKLDTGMSRIGFVVTDGDNSETVNDIERMARLPMLETEGIFSHFATADESDESYTRLQFDRFMGICRALDERGVNIAVRHICNSAGIMMYPEYHLDMVRPGIILYGMYPSDEVDRSKLDLKYVMSLKAVIAYVKKIEPKRGVSYGKEYIADGEELIATVPIGYADGYSRLLANKAEIAVGGKKFPVVGRICMDQCMINVTSGNNISRGDEALIFGNGAVTVDDMADWMNTINYEITCMVSRRIPRIYNSGGRTVKVLDYLL